MTRNHQSVNLEYGKIFKPIDADAIIAKYDQNKYRLFASKVKDVIYSILDSEDIRIHSITPREKDPKKLIEKIQRTGKEYKDPLNEITDLAGVRVISYFPSDVDKIIKELTKNFRIDKQKSIDKRKTSDPSVFGYASVHLIVEFSPERFKLPEYSPFENLKCEVQVRTILQHAWAEIEHDIVYKTTEDMPFELRRNFSSLAGLLEVADREFELIRKMEKEVSRKIKTKINKEKLDISIDFESIRFYLEKYHNLKEFDNEAVHRLIQFLNSSGLTMIQDFDNILTPERLSTADDYLNKIECKSKFECLLRYFLVVGHYFKMDHKGISDAADCHYIK